MVEYRRKNEDVGVSEVRKERQTIECCNHDCNQGRDCPRQVYRGEVSVPLLSMIYAVTALVVVVLLGVLIDD